MYVTSELGNTWIEKQSPVDLIACLEARYLFVYELLAELRKEPKNAKTLSIIAKVSTDSTGKALRKRVKD